jgi:hypothetical protein
MGAIVCTSAGISVLERETIINTRANKVRDLAAKISDKTTQIRRSSESESLNNSLQTSFHDRNVSVGFFSIVRERLYFDPDKTATPAFQDLNYALVKHTNVSCNSGHAWSSRTKAHIAGEGNRSRRSIRLEGSRTPLFQYSEIISLPHTARSSTPHPRTSPCNG